MESLGQKPIEDLTGRTFGRLTVMGPASERRHGVPTWDCKCQCAVILPVTGKCLKNGNTQSCGCRRRENLSTHGKSYTPTFRIWNGMINRCFNPNYSRYSDYGGRGITVCERWRNESNERGGHGFENFLADMGERPKGLTLDRKNNEGSYEPGNCRWATQSEQNFNQRKRRSKSN
jgi:hypothetical protein